MSRENKPRRAMFDRYVGIDYSGAREPERPIKGIRAFVAERCGEIAEQTPTSSKHANWSRQELAEWLVSLTEEDGRSLIGIDHAFSYPSSEFRRRQLTSWDDLLHYFENHWPTRTRAVRECPAWHELEGVERTFRLTDQWTQSALSIFHGWRGNGVNVFFSTHAGIPWLRWIRDRPSNMVHFWPFDGWKVVSSKSVIVEVYPRVFRRRYEHPFASDSDRRDAYLVCKWFQDRDTKGLLAPYFSPPLTDEERKKARLEGWILGVA